jgi:hypothetical protein
MRIIRKSLRGYPGSMEMLLDGIVQHNVMRLKILYPCSTTYSGMAVYTDRM